MEGWKMRKVVETVGQPPADLLHLVVLLLSYRILGAGRRVRRRLRGLMRTG